MSALPASSASAQVVCDMGCACHIPPVPCHFLFTCLFRWVSWIKADPVVLSPLKTATQLQVAQGQLSSLPALPCFWLCIWLVQRASLFLSFGTEAVAGAGPLRCLPQEEGWITCDEPTRHKLASQGSWGRRRQQDCGSCAVNSALLQLTSSWGLTRAGLSSSPALAQRGWLVKWSSALGNLPCGGGQATDRWSPATGHLGATSCGLQVCRLPCLPLPARRLSVLAPLPSPLQLISASRVHPLQLSNQPWRLPWPHRNWTGPAAAYLPSLRWGVSVAVAGSWKQLRSSSALLQWSLLLAAGKPGQLLDFSPLLEEPILLIICSVVPTVS